MYRFPWYLTLVSTNHASSNLGQIVNSYVSDYNSDSDSTLLQQPLWGEFINKFHYNLNNCHFLGTMLFYKPGLLAGGPVEHVCNPQRSVGYYLEAVVMLAPFCKKPLRLNLKGVTNDRYDPTVREKNFMLQDHFIVCCCNYCCLHRLAQQMILVKYMS